MLQDGWIACSAPIAVACWSFSLGQKPTFRRSRQIASRCGGEERTSGSGRYPPPAALSHRAEQAASRLRDHSLGTQTAILRSEEHTSELQSRQYLVCRLLLEKKKKTKEATIVIEVNI